MDKAHLRFCSGKMMAKGIQHIVAHIGARRVGHSPRHARFPDGRSHSGHRQRGKISGRPAGDNGRVRKLLPGVIGNGCRADIDADPLRGHSGPATGKAQAEASELRREVFRLQQKLEGRGSGSTPRR